MFSANYRGKLFFRYLFTYLALVLIPLTVLGSFYSISFFKTFSNEVFSNVDKDLANISISVDDQIDSFKRITKQISTTTQLRKLPAFFDPDSINELKLVLSNYKATNTFIQEIYLALPEMGYVLSSSTSCDLNYFTHSLLTVDGLSANDVKNFFTSDRPQVLPNATLCLPGFAPTYSLLFSFPIYSDSLRQLGTMVFCVQGAALDKLVSEKLSQYKAETIILSQEMRPVFSLQAPPAILEQFATQKPDALDQLLAKLEKNYIVRSYDSGASGFFYIALIPRNQKVFSQITNLNSMFLLASLLVVGISGIAVASALRLNYFPLQQLHDKAKTLIPKRQAGNELATIEDVLEHLKGQNIYLAAKLEDNATSIKINRLQKLLTNGYASIEDFNMDCQELDMNFQGGSFFVTISHIHAENVDLDKLGLQVKQLLSGKTQSYYLYGMEAKKLVMVHCLDAPLVRKQQLVEIFSEIHEALMKQYQLLLTTGIGSFVTDVTKMSHSYLNASSALDYCFVKGKGQVIGYNEIMAVNNDIIYPQQYFDKLKKGLAIKNEDAINHCIDKIIEIVEENNYPLPIARGICFNLINLVTNPPDNVEIRSFVKPDLFALAEVETIQEIVRILKEWRGELNALVAASTPSKQAVTVQSITEYLDARCLRSDFSIYEAAEYFGMTLPKFSQFFKDQTGKNVLDYTIARRMDEAARMLEATDDDIKDIVQRVGYYNTSSFIRRFKQVYGITPGDYRKAARKAAKEVKKNV